MHTTIVTSNAGQLRWLTTLLAAASMATARPIFATSQIRKPNAADTGLPRRDRDTPRASTDCGSSTAAMP